MDTMRNKKGFTLVEIAIVLVIIGLILGAILKGQGMIENAKVKNVIRQADSFRAAVYGFQDRYRYFPGDDPLASTHVGTPGGQNGNGNGQISGDEEYDLFDHLVAADLISGNYPGDVYATHAYGGNAWVDWRGVQGSTTHWVNFENIPGSSAQIIDSTIDDGIYDSGSVRGSGVYTAANVATFSIEF